MNTFDRRELFSFGLASAGLTAAPAWLRCWFDASRGRASQDPQDPQNPQEAQQTPEEQRRAQFLAAVKRARAEDKPVSVLIVPASDDQIWQRGQWLGALLNHGTNVARLELSCCVLACATAAEVREATGAEFDAEPALLLLDVREGRAPGAAPKATPVPFTFASMNVRAPDGTSWEDRQKLVHELVERELVRVGEALVKAMHVHRANVASMAERVARNLGDEQRARLASWCAGGARPDDELLVRGAAIVRDALASVDDERRAVLLDELLAAWQRSVVQQPVAGARWMVPGGCGMRPERMTEQEEKEHGMIGCGMAFLPPLCERFLGFYQRL